MVNAAKAFVIPDKLRIFPGANGEGVARPGFAFDNLGVDFITVFFIDAVNANLLFFVGPHFVVEHHIKYHGDIIFF
ncbi:hypothetical protein D3C75_533440 [compost metagenome]